MRNRLPWLECVSGLVGKALVAVGDPQPKVAEVGVAVGELSAYLLKNYPTLHLWMVDPWQYMPEYMQWLGLRSKSRLSSQEAWDNVYAAAVKTTAFAADRRTILRMKSVEGAQRIPDNSLSFVLIDAEHTRPAVLADCQALWPKLRAGGCLAGDDLCIARVKYAAVDWGKERGLEMEQSGKIWWFWKPL